ncbi:hypothetical protein [Ideonella sp. B508-1]|uniref:hypothetical protein n=1 Tax=Ideonella sp. B508-1 TaxID=137716 RepID=UPI00034C53AD|nr:hypothetical protein [Ideonella sp. B508-1]
MWKISRQSFGFVLTFSGTLSQDDLHQWQAQVRQELKTPPTGTWGVVVDMRTLAPLSPEAQKLMVEGQQWFLKTGMKRSAVALSDAVVTMQFRRLARESGIDAWERYINAEATPNWQSAAKRWVVEAVEPG